MCTEPRTFPTAIAGVTPGEVYIGTSGKERGKSNRSLFNCNAGESRFKRNKNRSYEGEERRGGRARSRVRDYVLRVGADPVAVVDAALILVVDLAVHLAVRAIGAALPPPPCRASLPAWTLCLTYQRYRGRWTSDVSLSSATNAYLSGPTVDSPLSRLLHSAVQCENRSGLSSGGAYGKWRISVARPSLRTCVRGGPCRSDERAVMSGAVCRARAA